MEKKRCALCKRPMGNSLSRIQLKDNIYVDVHKKCKDKFDCTNCLKMVLRGVEGKCICGNTVQINVCGDKYRILERGINQ